jgi:hypothetical protein
MDSGIFFFYKKSELEGVRFWRSKNIFKGGITTDSRKISYAIFLIWPFFIMVFLMDTECEFQILS